MTADRVNQLLSVYGLQLQSTSQRNAATEQGAGTVELVIEVVTDESFGPVLACAAGHEGPKRA